MESWGQSKICKMGSDEGALVARAISAIGLVVAVSTVTMKKCEQDFVRLFLYFQSLMYARC